MLANPDEAAKDNRLVFEEIRQQEQQPDAPYVDPGKKKSGGTTQIAGDKEIHPDNEGCDTDNDRPPELASPFFHRDP